jgi:hypothetical protein
MAWLKQCFQSGFTDPEPIQIQVFDDQKCKKITAGKKFDIF